MSLQIGTASFANKYGIINNERLFEKKEIEKIIIYCSKRKIILDSSPAYGLSLKFINMLSKDFISTVSTKVIIGNDNLSIFENKLSKHLSSLNNCCIDTLYFHEPRVSHLKNFPKYLDSAHKICKEFGVNKLGLSIQERI